MALEHLDDVLQADGHTGLKFRTLSCLSIWELKVLSIASTVIFANFSRQESKVFYWNAKHSFLRSPLQLRFLKSGTRTCRAHRSDGPW